jgi:hypothetical protein
MTGRCSLVAPPRGSTWSLLPSLIGRRTILAHELGGAPIYWR